MATDQHDYGIVTTLHQAAHYAPSDELSVMLFEAADNIEHLRDVAQKQALDHHDTLRELQETMTELKSAVNTITELREENAWLLTLLGRLHDAVDKGDMELLKFILAGMGNNVRT